MKKPRWLDPFTANMVRQIDPKVRDSLTPAQVEAIVDAMANTGGEDHVIDVRRGIPLFLSRYYFVFLVGRDQRPAVQRTEAARGKRVSWVGGLLFALLVASPFLLLVFLFVYLLKLLLGVDLFPHFHLYDILG
jgi:hypothetical protein